MCSSRIGKSIGLPCGWNFDAVGSDLGFVKV